MDYTTIVEEVMDRLNLSSSEAQDRIGRGINRVYRRVTTAIGMQPARRTTVSESTTAGSSSVTFNGTEKIISVVLRTVSPYRTLKEVTVDELEEDMPFSTSNSPDQYAIFSHTSNTVTIMINKIPSSTYLLYADVHAATAELSNIDEPAFPESFHDVIVEGVLADEYRKMEKAELAQIAKAEYEKILSDLKMFIATSVYKDQYAGKMPRTGAWWYNGD